MLNNPILFDDPNGDTPLHLGAAIVGGLINLGSQALKGNVTSLGAGLGYFGVGAAAGALYVTPGGQAAAGSLQVIGNKGIQVATGRFDVTEINSVGDVAYLGLDIATDYFSVAPAAKIGSNLASGLQKLAGSYGSSIASGGGAVIKTGVGGSVDDIVFSVSLSDEVVVSAAKSSTALAKTPISILTNASGKVVGQQIGNNPDIRTLGKDQAENIINQLISSGAKLGHKPGYQGIWYSLPNGGGFGVRSTVSKASRRLGSSRAIDLNIPGFDLVKNIKS